MMPVWPPKIGEFIVSMQSEAFIPAPFSPPLEPRDVGPLFEIRSYTLAPGAVRLDAAARLVLAVAVRLGAAVRPAAAVRPGTLARPAPAARPGPVAPVPTAAW